MDHKMVNIQKPLCLMIFGLMVFSVGECAENSGEIVTTANYADGMNSVTVNSININSGSITTSGIESYGINTTGSGVTNTNSGSITTSGMYSAGIRGYSGSGVTNINSGSITTSGYSAIGIYLLFADNATITNSGSITTSGSSSPGIYLYGSNGTVTNSGSITVSGWDGYGFLLSSSNSTVTNSGSITLSGSNSYGFFLSSSNSTVTNSGSITLSGSESYGIESIGANSIITNNGSITLSGSDSYGIESTGANSIITNSGVIRTSGAGGSAIFIYATNNTVNLNRGSVIVGDIFTYSFITGARLNINLGASVSYAYSVTGPWAITDLDNRPMVTGSAYAAGIGAQETAGEMLYLRTASLNNALNKRLRSYALDEANEPYWMDVYSSRVTRDSGANYSNQTAFTNNSYGLTMGYKLPDQAMPLELVANVEQSAFNIDSGHQKIDSRGLMVGALAPKVMDVLSAKLSAKALLGYAEHDGDRKVMTNSTLYDGSRQVTGKYSSTYAILGAALTRIYPVTNQLTADVLVGVDVNSQRIGSYSETDYFSWRSRLLTQVQPKLQVGADYKIWGSKGSVFARVGVENHYLISGKKQDYAINGTDVTYVSNNKGNTYITGQLGMKAEIEKGLLVYGTVSTLNTSDTVKGFAGNLGLRMDY